MYLDNIIEHKREEVRDMSVPDRTRTREFHDPVESLRTRPFITEIKKASPSMGDINTGVDVLAQARAYFEGGAGAISVLTDKKFFKGDFDVLQSIADSTPLPILCKDFIIHEKQIDTACVAGADFILLIAAVLTRDELKRLSHHAGNLGLKVLYELHDLEEFEKIRDLNPELVGVNSRNLKTFNIEKETACTVINQLEGNFLKVAESGIENAHDVTAFKKAGAGAFLVGTALMKSGDPVMTLKNFYSAVGADHVY